jgi:hypothetical protein
VDPESNKIFSNHLDLTVPMVSTTIMVTGVKFLVGGVSSPFSADRLRFRVQSLSHVTIMYM